MIRLNWLKNSEKFLKWGAVASGGVAAVLGFITRWKSGDYSGLRQDLLVANEASAWLTIPAFTALAGALTFFRTNFGTTNTWKVVTHLLEEYRKVVFAGSGDLELEADHHYRVTLYKHVRFRWAFCFWPNSNWVVPVARTGHTTQSWRIPRFLAPVGDPDRAKGVAGQAFARNSPVFAPNLPEVGPNASAKTVKNYAKKGYVDEQWVRKKMNVENGCSIRSMVGIPIEVEGRPWGSLVLDSRRPAEIIDLEALRQEEFKRMARLLSKLLEN